MQDMFGFSILDLDQLFHGSNHLFQPTKPDCTSEGRLTVKETSPRHQLDRNSS